MCFVHGLADGRYLIDEEILKPEDAVDVHCTCSQEHRNGATRRQALGRGVLGAGAAVIGNSILGKAVLGSGTAQAATGPKNGDRVVMLGTNGGPVVNPLHAQTSTALHITGHNDTTYLIDCGYETTRQMVAEGNLPFNSLRHVFVTHHHSDHISGYTPLALHSIFGQYGVNPVRRLDFWGPKPIAQMQRDFTSMNAIDIKARAASGTPDLRKMLHSHEHSLPYRGVRKVMEDGNVVVHATRVRHGSDMPGACAYRFTIKKSGRSIVFSGDTAPTRNLIDLADGADTLVHECMSPTGVELILRSVDPKQREQARKNLYRVHTDVVEVPSVAKAANVKRVILNHYVPVAVPLATYLSEAKRGATKAGFAGEILAPTELDSFTV